MPRGGRTVDKQGQGVGGTVQLCVFQQLVDGRLPPGCSETQGQEGPRPGFRGQLSPPSARLPGWRLGLSASLLSLQTIGPGARSGLTQRSVVSAPGWQGGPGSPEFANPLTPLLPGGTFPSLSGPAPVPGAAPKTPDPQLPGLAAAESSPGRVINVSVGRFAKGL